MSGRTRKTDKHAFLEYDFVPMTERGKWVLRTNGPRWWLHCFEQELEDGSTYTAVAHQFPREEAESLRDAIDYMLAQTEGDD